MNKATITFLREKHSACFANTYRDQYVCQYCSSEDVSTRLVFYPCDVIQVLDSWEIKVSETLDCLDQINTMRVDEDDYEWLQTAEFILKAEL